MFPKPDPPAIIGPVKHILFITLILSATNASAGRAYPRSPEPSLTPGALCTTPDSHRYPEQIAYCERALNSFNKESIFIAYRAFGYSLSGERSQYKVDHFIPLCAGGSNEPANLWPQYYTISKITDPMEALGCEVLAKGKISQKNLIEIIVDAKMDLKTATEAIRSFKKILKRP